MAEVSLKKLVDVLKEAGVEVPAEMEEAAEDGSTAKINRVEVKQGATREEFMAALAEGGPLFMAMVELGNEVSSILGAASIILSEAARETKEERERTAHALLHRVCADIMEAVTQATAKMPCMQDDAEPSPASKEESCSVH